MSISTGSSPRADRWVIRARGAQAVPADRVVRGDQQGGRAVGDLAGQRGGDQAALAQRLQRGHLLQASCRGAGPRPRLRSR